MVDVHRPIHHPDESEDYNERSLNSLVRAIRLASGRRFSLILAHCNYQHLRNAIMQQLRDACPVELSELTLPASAQTLYTAIKHELGDRPVSALIVSGLDQVHQLDKLLLSANQVRDEFNKQFHFPIVLWVNDQVLGEIVRLAPDFYNWASSPISFHWSPTELAHLLCQQSERRIAEHLRQSEYLRAAVESSVNGTNGVQVDAETRLLPAEVTTALDELEHKGYHLTPEVTANIQFALGCEAFSTNHFEQAIDNFCQSLAIWQQTDKLEQTSLVLHQLGRCNVKQAERDRANQAQHWTAADNYFQQCLEPCDAANRSDLKARFIADRGETLKHLQQWDELQQVIDEARRLYQEYSQPIEQARFRAFQAEVFLADQNRNHDAYICAQEALQQLSSLPEGQPYLAEICLLVARTQHKLGENEEAIATLRQARSLVTPDHNPTLYIRILEELRTLYFQQKQYDQAFTFKREQLSVESQYGFRAFVGAGRLRSTRAISSTVEQREVVAQEIAVSGRQHDLEKLIERIGRNDCKLTVFHGQLGVGKSSLLQAGLKPSLDQLTIQARDVITIVTRVYTNWAEKLGEYLTSTLQSKQRNSRHSLKSASELLEQLKENENHNLITVLVFDQFEEFFFICQKRSQRDEFFSFLSECLDIPYVKVILSLREDYLHYLLEWERSDAFDSVSTNLISDVLSKEHRYVLGNFSVSDAKNIIQTLTDNSQFYLQPHLIDRLVQDLVDERGEIRPIELQVVGAQLYEEKVRTLEQYEQLGDRPKEKLVQHYLDGVVGDCGAENEDAARLVLYTLTGENNTRPPKTREEIETDLKALEKGLVKEAEKLDLVLEIFRKSGLVFLIPELPADRYQLVHDYLVSFIRQQRPKIDELIKELETKGQELKQVKEQLRITALEKQIEEESQRAKLAEEKQKRNQAESKRNLILVSSTLLVLLSIVGSILWVRQADYSKEFAYQISSTLRIRNNHAIDLLQNQEIDPALVESLKAAESLRGRYSSSSRKFRVDSIETAREVINTLQLTIQQKALLLQEEIPEAFTNIDNFSAIELKDFLIDLVGIGCAYADQEVIEERASNFNLCE